MNSVEAMIFNPIKAYDLRSSAQIGLHSGKKGHLVAASALTTRLLAAEKGVINLNPPRQQRRLLALAQPLVRAVAASPA